MATRQLLGTDVYQASINRLVPLYEQGDRLVVSFSGGKDSGVILETCIDAARLTDRLPVDVLMRDEEAMFPGTFEYCQRVYERDEVSFHWISARQPIINVFDRAHPYWWVFDPELDPADWVRRPPAHCQFIPEPNIQSMITPERFPPADGHHLYAVLGLRVQESKGRLYGLYSSGGYLTRKPNQHGVYGCRPIYDWTDGDVWRAHLDGGWDYNSAYDVMAKSGLPRPRIRIAPPTMNVAGLDQLAMAAAAWPQWFDRLARRCPGVRLAVRYGRRAFQARHLPDESWEDTYRRECIDTAPAWIAERAERAAAIMTKRHAHHATTPFPQIEPCQTCAASVGSWQRLCRAMYGGDPFSIQTPFLPYVEPSRFRPGAPDWNGSPSF